MALKAECAHLLEGPPVERDEEAAGRGEQALADFLGWPIPPEGRLAVSRHNRNKDQGGRRWNV